MTQNHESESNFKLFLVRHGETEENKLGIIQGQSNTKLSNIGIEQAKKVGEKLSTIRFDYVFTSDLNRAYETTQEILKLNRFPAPEIVRDPLLRERKYGCAEGKLRNELILNARKRGVKPINYVPEGAETTLEVYQRAAAFFECLCKSIVDETENINQTLNNLTIDDHRNNEPRTILIVSHGWFLREFIKFLRFELKCKMPFDEDSKLQIIHHNSAISLFDLSFTKSQQQPVLTCSLFNNFDHLTVSDLENKTLCDM